MKPGDSIIIDGEAYEVLQITPEGDIHVKNIFTLECSWKDWFMVNAVDPHRYPGAVLDAMAAIKRDTIHEESEESREAAWVDPTETSDGVFVGRSGNPDLSTQREAS
jgi:hypothetical protein